MRYQMLLLLLLAWIFAACGDNVSEPVTLRDHVQLFAAAAEEQAQRCGRGPGTAARLESLLCSGRDCDAPPACEPAIDECIAGLDAMSCNDREFPSACFDLWPNFGCLDGGVQTP